MSAIGYYIFYGINWIITLLPLRVLISFLGPSLSCACTTSFHTGGKLLRKILKTHFLKKVKKNLKRLKKNSTDILPISLLRLSNLTHMSQQMQKRSFTYTNLEIIDRLREEKRDIIAVLGHYNNWEWLNITPILPEIQNYYNLINHCKTSISTGILINSRSKYGIVLTPTSQVIREIINYRKNNINTVSVFISDQIPAKGDIKYWTTFLNQDTPVFTGAGKDCLKI